MEIKPSELSGKFNDLASKLPEAVESAIDAGLVELDAQFSNRVWNQNEDINSKKFGKYKSTAYENYRKSLGRQVTDKDLQLFGGLRRSITIDYSEKALIFTDEKSVLIADGQERQMSNIIFEASKNEVDLVLDVIDSEFTIFTKSIIESE